MDKVQIMTRHVQEEPTDLREATVKKLHALIAEAEEHQTKKDHDEDKENDDEQPSSASLSRTASRSPSPFDVEHPDKIALDGRFSTQEMKELVDMAKERGILETDVDVKVVDYNDAIGDRVEVSEDN